MAREVWFPTRESFVRARVIGMAVTLIPFLPVQTQIACSIGAGFTRETANLFHSAVPAQSRHRCYLPPCMLSGGRPNFGK